MEVTATFATQLRSDFTFSRHVAAEVPCERRCRFSSCPGMSLEKRLNWTFLPGLSQRCFKTRAMQERGNERTSELSKNYVLCDQRGAQDTKCVMYVWRLICLPSWARGHQQRCAPMDLQKIDTVNDWQQPCTIRVVCGLLEPVGYCRKFT
jgi:hypothetical protein